MQIIRTVFEMQRASRQARSSGTLGLVPTMGALHEGHLSLIRRARAASNTVAASIFVNPTQFAANEDLARYPRTFDEDCAHLEREGVALLFAPTPEEVYPRSHGIQPQTTVDPGPIASRLDGASRPGHFAGVATVVAKLFHIAQPDFGFFGQKDAAQLAVLRQMVRDLNFPVDLVACPVVRDSDGLALSSRNRYLSVQERRTALVLPQTLDALTHRIAQGVRVAQDLLAPALANLRSNTGMVLDYLAIVDPDTLLPVPEAIPGTLIALAATVGNTRLIDNTIVPWQQPRSSAPPSRFTSTASNRT